MNLTDTDFELFDVPAAYAQDVAALDARWKALQREVHPDRFAGQGAAAQRVAMQWSARINEAYQRLRNPLRRAAYLCELKGTPIQAENNTAMPARFLVQQMEWREALEDGRNEHNETALLALDQEIAAEQQNLFAELSQAFAAQQTEQAGQLVRQGRFLNKLRQEIQAALP